MALKLGGIIFKNKLLDNKVKIYKKIKVICQYYLKFFYVCSQITLNKYG